MARACPTWPLLPGASYAAVCALMDLLTDARAKHMGISYSRIIFLPSNTRHKKMLVKKEENFQAQRVRYASLCVCEKT